MLIGKEVKDEIHIHGVDISRVDISIV